eukprot:m.143017 g.143017  ORF g.143017 m.143017 type:complete len:61 (-) comp17153_c5_seq1:653-835(-)
MHELLCGHRIRLWLRKKASWFCVHLVGEKITMTIDGKGKACLFGGGGSWWRHGGYATGCA